MPEELGYFHPEREKPTGANKAWLSENSLMTRRAYQPDAYVYDEAAARIDDIAIAMLTVDLEADIEQQDRAINFLKGISAAIINEFRNTGPAIDCLVMFVDRYEDGVLTAAHELWRRDNAMITTLIPDEKFL